MLRVGLAHGRRMGDKEIGHDTQSCRYRAAIKAIVVSSMRLEKPHSLSYHEDTLTSLPETLVSVASNTEERASWLKSIETRGAVLYPKSPASDPDSEADFMIALTSSTLVSRAPTKHSSTMETLIVGTRMA